MPTGQIHVTAAIRKAETSDDGFVRMYGWAAMSKDDIGEPVIDSDSEYIPIDELERAAQTAFLRRGGAGAVGVQHDEFGKADLVESFVLSADKREAFELGSGPQGWMVGLRSKDPEVIKAVRSGALLELSLRGRGRIERTQVPRGNASMILKSDSGTPDELETVGIVRELELADAELLSIVDRGASANKRVRSRIVLVKRAVEGDAKEGAMPKKTDIKKARSPQVILADLFETGKLADVPPEDKEALLMALSSMPMTPSAPAPEPEIDDEPIMAADDEMPKGDDEMPKAEDKDEPMVKRHKELQKENVELRADLADLRKRMERSEVVDMVKRDMLHFPGASVDELADMVQEARLNLGKSDSEKLETMLKAASKACESSDAFKATGVRKGNPPGDAASELLALAKSKRDANPNLSRHEALRIAGKERPDLWAARNH